MEIYNEICYDLLSHRESRTAIRLEELPRVLVLEDKKGEPHLRNLSVLPVATEEEAMRLFFLGETNRAIAETPSNEYSSRSHCIFTIYVTARPAERETLRSSKLNLVDLAGSERVHKSRIIGKTLKEARNINLSLHFLQQVILALSESRRAHIPYRNSLLTFILKDSLGGNCLTVMLATLATSQANLQETISTCKFAQRVSLIKTDAVINVVSDPAREIRLLNDEIAELKRQLADRQTSVVLCQTLPAAVSKHPKKKAIEAKLIAYMEGREAVTLDVNAETLRYCCSFFKEKISQLERELEETGKLDAEMSQVSGRFASEAPHSSEIKHYEKLLERAYEKAKLHARTIEECQANIGYIRGKLEVASKGGDARRKLALASALEHQQTIYRNCLIELKKLKNETFLLEAGLTRVKVENQRREVDDFYRLPKCPSLSDENRASSDEDCRCNCYSQAYEDCHPSSSSEENRHGAMLEASCSSCSCVDDLQLVPKKLRETSRDDCREVVEATVKTNEDPIKPDHDPPPPPPPEIVLRQEELHLTNEASCNRNKRYEIFTDTDTEEFKNFMGTVALTGDEEIDSEICSFYRAKMCS